MTMSGGGAGRRQADNNDSARMYLEFINDLTLSRILPKFASLIKAECERTGMTAIEVIDEGLKSGPKALKMKFSSAMQAVGFTAREANATVEELFRRLAEGSSVKKSWSFLFPGDANS